MDYRRIFRLRPGRRSALRTELDDELRTHIELRVEALIAAGMSPEEARAEAERRFGDLASARRALYASARRREARLRWGRLLEDALRDTRLAFRRIRRAPGYASVSVAILALGIALSTVMFTLFDGVLLRPLPFPDADRLVSLQSMGTEGTPYDLVSIPNWYDWREQGTTLAATGLVGQHRAGVRVGTESFRASHASVGGDYFDVLRPRLLAGRPLVFDDGQSATGAAVLTSSFARRHFGSPDGALGRALTVAGRPHEVVGVIADTDVHPEGSELFTAFRVRPGSGGMRNNINFRAIGRVRADVPVDRVRVELNEVARRIREEDPEGAYHSHGVGVLPLHEVIVADATDALRLLMLAVFAVLLVACANLAGLGLARARARLPEVELRMALGSGRGHVVRQILVEHLAVAALGGVLGFVLAWGVGGPLLERVTADLPRASAISLDGRIALFTALATAASGLLAGLAPALRLSGSGARSGSRTGARRRSGRGAVVGGRGLPGGVLVAGEVALALAILVGGGLLLRSFDALTARDLGYDPEGVVTAEVALDGAEYRSGALAVEYWTTLIGDLERQPEVRTAAVANWIPTGIGGTSFIAFPDEPEPDFGAGYRVVSDAYFEAMGIGLLTGRTFDATDDVDTERVVVVNRAMAERAWPEASAVGQYVAATSMEAWMNGNQVVWLRVIGVVDDVRHDGYESEPAPELYVIFRQVPSWTTAMHVVVRGTGLADGTLAASVGETIRSTSAAPAVDVALLDERLAGLLRSRVVTQRILVGFALAALLLTCLGIYGLVAHAASQRTREIAVRAALGAGRTGLLGLMLRGAGRVILIGTGVGLVVAYGLTGWLDSMLVDVSRADPATFAGAALILAIVGILAALVPSVQAARLDPLEALRGE